MTHKLYNLHVSGRNETVEMGNCGRRESGINEEIAKDLEKIQQFVHVVKRDKNYIGKRASRIHV